MILCYQGNKKVFGMYPLGKQFEVDNAKARSEETGIAMEVYTDLPGVQFYTAAGLHEKFHCKFGVTYKGFGGFCLETQYFPNAMNVEGFEKPILKAGDVYESTTVYKFMTE